MGTPLPRSYVSQLVIHLFTSWILGESEKKIQATPLAEDTWEAAGLFLQPCPAEQPLVHFLMLKGRCSQVPLSRDTVLWDQIEMEISPESQDYTSTTCGKSPWEKGVSFLNKD